MNVYIPTFLQNQEKERKKKYGRRQDRRKEKTAETPKKYQGDENVYKRVK